jgi:hypothetical protein
MKINHPTQRFVWLVGAIHEEMPDLPNPECGTHPNSQGDGNNLVLWDRQEKQPVMTTHNPYTQAMCLELNHSPACMPFTTLENWFNELDNKSLKAENLPITRKPFKPSKL